MNRVVVALASGLIVAGIVFWPSLPVVTLESAQPFGGLLVKLESVHLKRRRRLARDPYVNVSGGARLSLGLGRVARALLAESFAADPPSNSQMLEGNEYRI